MEHIYRLTYGPYYEEQELGYLTEDKLNDYLEELFHSTLMRNRVYSHLETLRARKAQYENKRHNAIQDMNRYLSILQAGKQVLDIKMPRNNIKNMNVLSLIANVR